MAKKKKSKKRSVSKGVGRQAPKQNVEKKPAVAAATKDEVVVEKKTADVAVDPRWGYVGRDVKRVGIIGGLCTALLLGIYFLFSATGIDEQLYQLINL